MGISQEPLVHRKQMEPPIPVPIVVMRGQVIESWSGGSNLLKLRRSVCAARSSQWVTRTLRKPADSPKTSRLTAVLGSAKTACAPRNVTSLICTMLS